MKVIKDKSTPEKLAFWRTVEAVAKEVRAWPVSERVRAKDDSPQSEKGREKRGREVVDKKGNE